MSSYSEQGFGDASGELVPHTVPDQGFFENRALNLLILRLFPNTTPKDAILRFFFAAVGFSPIGSVCLSTFRFIPLQYSGPLVVVPAILAAVLVCRTHRMYIPRVLEGLASGVIAVTLYDMTRIPFLAAGMWPDFIPKIGSYLLNSPDPNYSLAHWVLGYAWRYIGNGGGMGLAFYMVFPIVGRRLDTRLSGTLYGLGIFGCLLVTLYLSPDGTSYLFDPSLLTGSLGLVGHIVYGFILGTCAHYLNPEVGGNLRRSLLVDPKLQFGTAAVITAVMALLCGMNLMAINNFIQRMLVLLSGAKGPEALQQVLLARRTFLTVAAITEMFFVVVVGGLAILITHKIVGPTYRLRRLMADIAEGKLPEKMGLRKGDYLEHELPEEAKKMLETLRKHWKP
jgi:hypothetical protein